MAWVRNRSLIVPPADVAEPRRGNRGIPIGATRTRRGSRTSVRLTAAGRSPRPRDPWNERYGTPRDQRAFDGETHPRRAGPPNSCLEKTWSLLAATATARRRVVRRRRILTRQTLGNRKAELCLVGSFHTNRERHRQRQRIPELSHSYFSLGGTGAVQPATTPRLAPFNIEWAELAEIFGKQKTPGEPF